MTTNALLREKNIKLMLKMDRERERRRKANLKKKIKKGTQFGILTPQGVEKQMTININKLKSPDPLAYGYGLFHGKSGKQMAKAEKGDKLAPEYKRGFEEGKRLLKKAKQPIK